MYVLENNSGGSIEASGKSLRGYLKEYRKLGNHVKRYKFAQALVFGKDVIDFGCGYGAGAVFLYGRYKNYFGIDIDEEAIAYAKSKIEPNYKGSHFYKLTDFLELNPPVMSEVVICFEVFEHVKDVEGLISLLKSMVKKNGKILFSTPNGLSSNGNKLLFRSKFHIYEFTPVEFFNLLSPHGALSMYGERRIDSMDVRALKNRMNSVNGKIDSKNDYPSSLGDSILFKLANRFLNGSFFWKIYQINPLNETVLTCSTLLTVLEP